MNTKSTLRILVTLLSTLAGAYLFFLVLRWAAANSFNPPAATGLTVSRPVDSVAVAMHPGAKKSTIQAADGDQAAHPGPVTPDMLQKAVVATNITRGSFPWWTVILLGVLVLASVLAVLYYNLPLVTPDIIDSRDPEQLTELFAAFGDRIILLGNPRKIKRLSNKIRFQFYYLQNRKSDAGYDLHQLVNILLLLESHADRPSDVARSNTTEDSPMDAFDRFLDNNQIRLADPYRRIGYALNRDSFC